MTYLRAHDFTINMKYLRAHDFTLNMKYLKARKLNESSARDNLTFLTLPILTRYPECASSHLRNKTAFSPSPSSVQNDLWPEVLQKFPILSFYVRFLMKWHTVSVNIPRGSYYSHRKIYMNRIYISLSSLPYNPNIMPYNSINVQNACISLQILLSPLSPDSLPSIFFFPTTFRYCPSGSPCCCRRPLSQPHLICYSMFSRFVLPFQLSEIRFTRACSILPASSCGTSYPVWQTFPLHNNTSPFS